MFHALQNANSLKSELVGKNKISQMQSSPSRNMPRVPKHRAYMTVIILFAINLLNYMDRLTVAGVLTKIESYFQIDHDLAGLLQTVFIVSYMILAPIFGYLGDRYSRKFIMIFGLVVWSCTTFVSTLVTRDQYWLFFVCRGLVGIGEASYSTVASTVIADLFVGDKRTQMLALFYFAIPVGSGLGYVVGSKVSTAFGGKWEWGLRVTPALGLLLLMLSFFFIVEPVRGQVERSQVEGEVIADHDVVIRHSWFNDVKHIVRCKTYLWSTAGFTLMCFVTGALAWWAPEFVGYAQSIYYNKRVTENDNNISLIFGGITCAAGFLGVALGAELSRRYRARNPSSDALVCAFGLLGSIPFLFLTLVFASKQIALSYILLFVGEILMFMTWCPVADILLAVIPPQYRATASALQILISHLFGDAGSPYIVGLVTDRIRGPSKSLVAQHRGLLYAFFMAPFVTALSGAFFLVSSFYLTKDRAAVKATVTGQTEENRTLLNHESYEDEDEDDHDDHDDDDSGMSSNNVRIDDDTGPLNGEVNKGFVDDVKSINHTMSNSDPSSEPFYV